MESNLITMLNELDAKDYDFTIKVRVIRMWRNVNKKNPKDSYSIEMIVVDEQGTRMHATCQSKWFSVFEKFFEQGACLKIQCPTLGSNFANFKFIDNPHKLCIFNKTKIVKCDDLFGSFYGFRFTHFTSIKDKSAPENETIDVIGSVVRCFDTAKKVGFHGMECKRRTMQIEDPEGNSIYVTLFDEYEEQFSKYTSENKDVTTIVIILQFGRLQWFGGKPYVFNTYKVTRLFVNDDIDEINLFKKRCSKKVLRKVITIPKGDGSDEFEEQNVFECLTPKCAQEAVSAEPRIKLGIRVQDATGMISLTLFDGEANRIFRKSTKEFLEKYLEGGYNRLLPDEFYDLMDKKYAFKIEITDFNLKTGKQVYTIAKMTDDSSIIGELEIFFTSNEVDDYASMNAMSVDVQSQETDVVSFCGDNGTPISDLDKNPGKRPCLNEKKDTFKADNELKRSLCHIYDVDEEVSFSATKARPTGAGNVKRKSMLIDNATPIVFDKENVTTHISIPYPNHGVQFIDRNRDMRSPLSNITIDLKENAILGQVQAVVYTVEFQKRGLPHAHVCLFMHPDHKLPTVEYIDPIISAEIPEKNEDPELYSLVKEFMIHGPCGNHNLNCPCMIDNKCSKKFPKRFCANTTIDGDGFPVYRRRDYGTFVEKSGVKLDNRSVVPYNKLLLKRYQAHINVEWCNQAGSIKYLFKYINKGPDRATLLLEQSNKEDDNNEVVDEIQEYYDCRYLSACEATWRIFSFDIHYRTPSVMRLPFHLPGQQQVVYGADDDIENVLTKESVASSMFLSWMKCNATNDKARKLTYVEFPTQFVWKKKERSWEPRRRGFSIGRIHSVSPSLGEAYFLRILLNKVRGPISFEEILTVNGHKCSTFRDACYKLGLLDDDTEYIEAIEEASHSGSGYFLRSLFATMLLSGSLSRPDFVWQNTWKFLSDGILYKQQLLLKYPGLSLTDDRIQNLTLFEIEKLLLRNSSSLRRLNLIAF
ncbi:hypothetical protein L1987_75818 [Smallanthus sonchifolius]|uniref:Uncharacterized protein n=1 Tax=Smallanthus sonchifolius TaxID=185202 RepID=A0ACB9A7I1_9ASTR|nr:hypothetical protein L1987_75818 [Smallanthus sonchifolius]